MRKQFDYCIELPHGIYDVEGIAVAEDGRLIEFQTKDEHWHYVDELTKPYDQRTIGEHILYAIMEAIRAGHADDIDETREPERADTAPVYV